MQKKINIPFLTLFFFLLSSTGSDIFAGGQDVSAIRALQMFDSGNYAEAERIFRILLDEEPGNPMLNYYYGASRTENGHFGDSELTFLLKAGKNITPDRLHYYLGIQYHAGSDWEQALNHYNQFRLSVPEKEQDQLDLAQKIQQCFDHINPYPFTPVDAIGDTVRTLSDEPGLPAVNANTTFVSDVPANEPTFGFVRELLPDLPGVEPTYPVPGGHPVEFQVNQQITYLFSSQFQTREGKELFEEGRELENRMKELLEEAGELRKQYEKASGPGEKSAIGEKILSHEDEVYILKEEINRLYTVSRDHENNYWEIADPAVKHNFIIELEKIRAGLEKRSEGKNQPLQREDTVTVLLPGRLTQRYDLSTETPAGTKSSQLVYKIQIGAYSRGIPAYRKQLFNKLSLIRKIDQYTDENGVTVYTTGNLNNLEDAQKMQSQVKQEGIKEAIIIPYFNGKRITLEQAIHIENGDDIKRN